MDRFGVELIGVLASLAVFSLIIVWPSNRAWATSSTRSYSLDRPFDVGDRPREEQLGTVVSVGILSTKILTLDEARRHTE